MNLDASDDAVAAIVAAVRSNDVAAAAAVLREHPELESRLNEPLAGLPFDATLLQPAVKASNRAMISFLVDAGVDINGRSHWWAGGFGVFEYAERALVPFLLERGAVMTIHGAARLDLVDEARRLLDGNPALIHARGGDGQTPLHYAASIDMARLLLDRGADIDALDVDHESTPAQYLVREHPDVAAFLVQQGAHADILMASALGDPARVERILNADPAAIQTIVSDAFYPKLKPRAGGSIYIWTLGANMSPHLIAHDLGNRDVFELLMARSPAALKIATACELGDEQLSNALLDEYPDATTMLTASERARLVAAAERHSVDAVRLMLHAGWPVNSTNPHGATALHFAAFYGNLGMASEILAYSPDLDIVEKKYGATALGWARHGAENAWNRAAGEHTAVIELLTDEGRRNP